MYKYLLVTCLFVICALGAFAQKPDTTSRAAKKASSKDTLVATRADSLKARQFKPRAKKEKVYHPDSLHDPNKALVRSLILPGWGELYKPSLVAVAYYLRGHRPFGGCDFLQ